MAFTSLMERHKSPLHSLLLGAAFAAAASFAGANPAMALDAKQCLPMAEMNAALKAEGQRTMIIGDREALSDPTGRIADASIHRFVNTVTSNTDGSVGYQLEGDLPRAQSSTKVCVRAKLTNIQLFDPRVPIVPKVVLLGGQFDNVVNSYAAKGVRPMVLADTVQRSSDGERKGLPFVMFGDYETRVAAITTRMPDGRPQFLVGMADTEYTPAGLEWLAKHDHSVPKP